jgi:hypothetical protein
MRRYMHVLGAERVSAPQAFRTGPRLVTLMMLYHQSPFDPYRTCVRSILGRVVQLQYILGPTYRASMQQPITKPLQHSWPELVRRFDSQPLFLLADHRVIRTFNPGPLIAGMGTH